MPDCPQISLYLINSDFYQGPLSAEAMAAVMAAPAYWAFCWASGQALAARILENPEWVRGRSVLDFGAGSGVVGVAAALAGAAHVVACDLDPDARQACRANAELNDVEIEIIGEAGQRQADVLFAADVLYDRENLPLLSLFQERAAEVWVADSRIRDFDFPPYRERALVSSHTLPDFDEFDEFKQVRFYSAVEETPSQ